MSALVVILSGQMFRVVNKVVYCMRTPITCCSVKSGSLPGHPLHQRILLIGAPSPASSSTHLKIITSSRHRQSLQRPEINPQKGHSLSLLRTELQTTKTTQNVHIKGGSSDCSSASHTHAVFQVVVSLLFSVTCRTTTTRASTCQYAATSKQHYAGQSQRHHRVGSSSAGLQKHQQQRKYPAHLNEQVD